MRICAGTSCRTRARSVASFVPLFIATGCIPGSEPAITPRYTIEALLSAPVSASIVDVNDAGVVLGTSGGKAFLWGEGQATEVSDCSPADMDNLGRVACEILSAKAPGLWHAGQMQRLPSDTSRGKAFGVSEAGFVGLDVEAGGHRSIVVWKLGEGVIRTFDFFSGIAARGISNAGTFAATAPNGLYPAAFIFAETSTPAGIGRVSGASRVTDGGYVIGSHEVSPATREHRTVMWEPPHYSASAAEGFAHIGVDAQGSALVRFDDGAYALLRDGKHTFLAPAIREWELVTLSAISEGGVIAGTARRVANGEVAVVVLRPLSGSP
jgi:hypothetical protein